MRANPKGRSEPAQARGESQSFFMEDCLQFIAENKEAEQSERD